MSINIQQIEDVLKDCVQTYILPRFQSLQDEEVNTKTGASDLVTIADIEAEAALDRILPDLYPGSVVIGEESVSRGDKSLVDLSSFEGVSWIVDPVDGTYNFVHGRKEFAIMLARVENGETTHAWIYDIPGDRMLGSEKGSGTVINGEIQKFDSDTIIPINNADGFAGRKYFPKILKDNVDNLDAAVSSLSSLSCAGHEYFRLITGEKQFSIYTRTRPWDHLAGSLCLTEAGGISKQWDQQAYKPTDEKVGIINACNQQLWDSLYTHSILDMVKIYQEKIAS